MTYRGTVRNGMVVLEEGAVLPEGQVVEVLPAEGPTWAEILKDFVGKAEGLPPDAARNHDHYLYGAPKK